MRLFSKQDNSATGLQDRTRSILSVFTETVLQLKEINETAKTEIAEKEKVIKEAEIEKASLEKLTVDNEKVINNINQILQ